MERPTSTSRASAENSESATARVDRAFLLGYTHASAQFSPRQEKSAEVLAIPSQLIQELIEGCVLIRRATEVCRDELQALPNLPAEAAARLKESAREWLEELDAAAGALEVRAERLTAISNEPVPVDSPSEGPAKSSRGKNKFKPRSARADAKRQARRKK